MKKTLNEQEISELNSIYEHKPAEEVLKWGFETFENDIALATSFGAEDVVLIDILVKVVQRSTFNVQRIPRIFTLDTGRLPQETYKVWSEIEKKYNIKVEPYFPETTEVEEMLLKYGPNLFYDSIELRRLCCNVRKVKPLKRALSKLSAWITGLRREQSVTRAEIKKIEFDSGNNIIKLNPLTDWTETQVWNYIKKNNIPYNKLHDQNYPSIGCAPCTRAVNPGEDIRAGRWWWESPDKKECGLHK